MHGGVSRQTHLGPQTQLQTIWDLERELCLNRLSLDT